MRLAVKAGWSVDRALRATDAGESQSQIDQIQKCLLCSSGIRAQDERSNSSRILESPYASRSTQMCNHAFQEHAQQAGIRAQLLQRGRHASCVPGSRAHWWTAPSGTTTLGTGGDSSRRNQLRDSIPFVKFAYEQRAAFGILPRKLTAERTAAALPARLYWAPQNDPRRDVRCEEHSRTSDSSSGRTGAWDYICTFVPRPEVSQKRLKVGVRVRHDAITDVSTQYELDAGYVK